MLETDVLLALLSRIFFAVACGAVVGFERERRHAPAGFKTQILVCVGTAVMASLNGFLGKPTSDTASRIIGQIITGVGFLGAGAVIHSQENHVLGLTTAAWIWFIAAMGVLCGLDHGLVAVSITIVLAVIVFVAGLFENIYLNKHRGAPVRPKDPKDPKDP